MKAGTLEIEIVAEIARLQADLASVKKSLKGVDDAIKPANDNFNKFGKGATGAGNSAKLAGHQIQNLAYQANDLFVGLASGQKPMTVFMQQGSQIAQIMAQARIGVGGLAKELGGMAAGAARAHPVLTAVAAAAVAAGTALTMFTSEVNSERRAELDAYAKSLGLTTKEIEELGGAAITAGDVFRGLWAVLKEALGLEKVFTILKNTAIATFNGMMVAGKYAGAGIYAALAGSVDGVKVAWKALPSIIGESAVGAANLAIAAIERMINNALAGMNVMIGLINRAFNTSIATFGTVNLGRVQNQWAGAGKAAADGVISGYKRRFNEGLAGMDAAGSRLSDAFVQAAKDRLAAGVPDAVDKAGKGAKGSAGKAGKDTGDKFAEELNKALYAGIADLMDGNKDFWKKWENGVNNAWKDLGEKFAEEAKVAENATIDWNAELQKTIDLLDKMGAGGLGNIGAAIVGLTSGDFSGVRGKGGALLQSLSGVTWRNDQNQIVSLRGEIISGLDKVFGESGSFAKTMNGLLQGAATGVAIGGLVGGGKGGSIGGASGGAIGSALPIPGGQIIGAIAGSLLGGLFNTVKKGVATFSGTGLVSTRGNSNSRIAGATSAGNNVLDALSQIADAFGADIGDASFSLGIRKKSYTLDPTGQGRTKGAGVLNFGQDSEAAIKAAIKDAISDGVFLGLSEGVQRLLNGEGDIEKQLQKALDFQGVFDDLKQRQDPTGYGLEQLDKQFAKLRTIFDEAGASTEEYAKLEQLFQLKRQDIIDEGTQAALEKERARRELEIQLMELSGDTLGALATSRQLELDGMDAALRPLQERIYALQDEARITAEKQSLEDRLAIATGGTVDAMAQLIRKHEEEKRVVDPLNAALLETVQSAEKAALAQQQLAQAQEQAAQKIMAIVGALGGLGGGLSGLSGGSLSSTIGGTTIDLGPLITTYLSGGASSDATAAAIRGQVNTLAAATFPGSLKNQANLIYQFESGVASQAAAAAGGDPNNPRTGVYGGVGLSPYSKKPGINLADDQRAKKEADRQAKLDDLHSRLAEAYDREKKAIEDLIEPFKKVREEFAAFKDELKGALGGRDSFAVLSTRFLKTSALAASGDIDAMQSLVGVSRDYLGAAKGRTGSLVEYQRFVAAVTRSINAADLSAADAIDYQEEQLKALDRQVEGQIEANKKLDTIADLLRELKDETGGMRSEQRQLGAATAINTRKTNRVLDRTTRGGTALATETVF